MKFSEVDPLRGDAVASLLGVKLNDGVLECLGGDAGFALEFEGEGEVASEVVVGGSGLKLGVAGGFATSSGFANANGLLALAGSASGAFGAANENGLLALAGSVSGAFDGANEKVGSAGLLLGGAVGAGDEVMAGNSLTAGESFGESPPSSTNGPAGFGGWLNKELGALCFG